MQSPGLTAVGQPAVRIDRAPDGKRPLQDATQQSCGAVAPPSPSASSCIGGPSAKTASKRAMDCCSPCSSLPPIQEQSRELLSAKPFQAALQSEAHASSPTTAELAQKTQAQLILECHELQNSAQQQSSLPPAPQPAAETECLGTGTPSAAKAEPLQEWTPATSVLSDGVPAQPAVRQPAELWRSGHGGLGMKPRTERSLASLQDCPSHLSYLEFCSKACRGLFQVAGTSSGSDRCVEERPAPATKQPEASEAQSLQEPLQCRLEHASAGSVPAPVSAASTHEHVLAERAVNQQSARSCDMASGDRASGHKMSAADSLPEQQPVVQTQHADQHHHSAAACSKAEPVLHGAAHSERSAQQLCSMHTQIQPSGQLGQSGQAALRRAPAVKGQARAPLLVRSLTSFPKQRFPLLQSVAKHRTDTV